MPAQEWSKFWHNAPLDVDLIRAFYVNHAYPRHSHDYYVICLIERGLQSFSHNGTKQYTPPGGVILINPGDVHTGESANSLGFEMRSIYPTVSHMQNLVFELTGRSQKLPFFPDVRVDLPWVRDSVLAMHNALMPGAGSLESESIFAWNLAQLIKYCADLRLNEPHLGNEHTAVQKARLYIEEFYAAGISLAELAAHVSLSPYYLLRAFRAEVGLPPHSYLASVRIRHAQRLIEAGIPLAHVAGLVGLSSQSHLNHHFKQFIGVTPGQYAQQFK
ncbi:MAG: AraC family transcriptional regulator [Anaerolineaceae bacterium]|nr:AraC family transcriptional regulator [Anaerolineaceae bacterium]